jgi:hypothetical protein
MQLKALVLFVVFFLLPVSFCFARLGEKESICEQRYGRPVEEQFFEDGKTAAYLTSIYDIKIHYDADGIATSIQYRLHNRKEMSVKRLEILLGQNEQREPPQAESRSNWWYLGKAEEAGKTIVFYDLSETTAAEYHLDEHSLTIHRTTSKKQRGKLSFR